MNKHFDLVDEWVQEQFPDLTWNLFYDLDRFINTELWHGPVPEYWADNPMTHYNCVSYDDAMSKLNQWIADANLPHEIYIDTDCDMVIGENDPYEDNDNWADEDGDYIWVGPSEYEKVEVLKVLLYDEVWKMI